jgi:hypothetical protein
MSQLADIEHYYNEECQNQSQENERHTFSHGTDDKLTTGTAKYFLCVHIPDALRNLGKEEIDVIDESNAYNQNCDYYKNGSCALAAMFYFI